jgi:hypothetical protein
VLCRPGAAERCLCNHAAVDKLPVQWTPELDKRVDKQIKCGRSDDLAVAYGVLKELEATRITTGLTEFRAAADPRAKVPGRTRDSRRATRPPETPQARYWCERLKPLHPPKTGPTGSRLPPVGADE